jgi:cytochrome c peroxidase
VTLIVVSGCGLRNGQVSKAPQARQEQVAKKPVNDLSKDRAESPMLEPQKVLLGAPELLAGIPGKGPVTVAEIENWLDDPDNHASLDIELPMWLKPGAGQVKNLQKNPLTRAKIELGRQLFFDKRLSADNTVSCASCHEPEKGYTVSTPFATGINGQQGKRNPPTLLNRVMLAIGNDQQFWDGRTASVEDALLHALEDPTEMAASPDATIDKLKTIQGYRLQFGRIYKEVSWNAVGDALGAFVRCLVTDNSPYDYQVDWWGYEDLDQEFLDDDPALAAAHGQAKAAADAHPMSESARRGQYLFFGNKAWCSACHNGVNFTDEQYHNIGIGLQKDERDLGRYSVTKKATDWGAFKTPSIRAALWTAPYMHDGSLATLEDVIEWYAHEGMPNRNLDSRFTRFPGMVLTEQDKQDLLEFVKSCSGPLPKVTTGRLPE